MIIILQNILLCCQVWFADVTLYNLICPTADYVAQGHLKFEILNLKIWSYKYILMPSFGGINIFQKTYHQENQGSYSQRGISAKEEICSFHAEGRTWILMQWLWSSYLWKQMSPTLCRGRSHPECLSQTFPSLDLYLQPMVNRN